MRVATLRDGPVDVFRVIGANVAVQAVLLHSGLALLALSAGVDEATDADAVTNLKLGDVLAHRGDNSGNLMADGQREVSLSPLITNGVDIRVADTRGLDVDNYIILARVAALDFHDLEWCIGRGLLKCFSLNWHENHPTPVFITSA